MVQKKQSDRQDLACGSPVFNLCCDTVDAQLVFQTLFHTVLVLNKNKIMARVVSFPKIT